MCIETIARSIVIISCTVYKIENLSFREKAIRSDDYLNDLMS